MFDLAHLTPEQRQALTLDAHVFVEASAGSGKTAVLVARYLHILASRPDCDPTHILAVTYTRKAAAEMRHRIRQALENTLSDRLEDQIRIQHCLAQLPFATITTIHAFCKDMISEHSHAAGISPQIQVPSDEDREWAWQRSMECELQRMLAQRDTTLEAQLSQQPLQALREGLTQLYQRDEISRRFSDRDHDDRHHSGDLKTLFQGIRTVFQAEKQRMGWLDFPDMISEMAALAKRDADVATDIHRQYRFVMVDEFQDTDSTQWELFKTLFLQDPPRNLFLVGDLKQAIYRFRGAEPLLFSEVRHWMRHNGGIVIVLTQNFRSQQPLITFSNRLFQALFESSPTVDYAALHAVKQAVDRDVYIGICAPAGKEEHSETDLIRSWILHMKTKHQAEWSDFAILCRKTSGLTRIGSQLKAAGFPMQHLSAPPHVSRYYQDIYLLASLMVYPHDPVAWTGLLRSPLIGMGDDDLLCLHQERLRTGSLVAAFALEGAIFSRVRQLVSDMKTLRKDQPLGKSVAHLCQRYQWQAPRTLGYSDTAHDAALLLAQLALWDSQVLLSDSDRLSRMATAIQSGQIQPQTDSVSGIQLMTIHKAKGLEFPFVVIPECGRSFHASRGRKLIISDTGIVARMPGKDAAFKDYLAEEESQSMDEEKRIFYVACTRAKEEILLTATVKLSEDFPEDFISASFWEFLAPYAKVEERTLYLNFPPNDTQDSAPLACPRWTAAPIQTQDDPHHSDKEMTPMDHIHPTPQQDPVQNTAPHLDSVPSWDTLLGTTLHQILAHLWQASTPPENLEVIISTHLNQQFGDSATTLLAPLVEQLHTHLITTLQSPLAQVIFAASQKYSEWPFTWTEPGRDPRDGRIDLFFESEGRWHIVDFKSTDTPEVTPEMLQTLIFYQKAVAHHLQIPANAIQTSVFFTGTGEWVGL